MKSFKKIVERDGVGEGGNSLPWRQGRMGSTATIAILAMVVGLSFQGSRGIYETTEGRYAECAREMLESGNFVEPTLGYKPHWTKPPMAYWTIAAGVKLLGTNAWGARLFNVLAFVLTALAVTALGDALFGKRTGLLAGLIYVSSPATVFGANAISTDTVLTFWETVAILAYVWSWRRADTLRRRRLWLTAMWTAFGAAFLTKGPPALLPLVPIGIWHFRNRRGEGFASWAGIAGFALVGIAWYIVVCARNEGLLHYFLGEEVVGRVTSPSVHNDEWYKAFNIYLPVLLFGTGAWSYCIVREFFGGRRNRRRAVLGRIRSDPRIAFIVLWFTVPLGVFFLSASKLYLYILPLFAPMSLIGARCLLAREGRDMERLERRAMLIAVVSCMVLVGAKAGLARVPTHKDMARLYRVCRSVAPECSGVSSIDQEKLFGLQFYFGGRLRRLSSWQRRSWSDAMLSDLTTELRRGIPAERQVLVVRTEQSPSVADALAVTGANVAHVTDTRWDVFAVKPVHAHAAPLGEP